MIDADLSGYFDSIPHVELIQCGARRISDREMLALINRFLTAPVSDRHEPEHADSHRVLRHGATIVTANHGDFELLGKELAVAVFLV